LEQELIMGIRFFCPQGHRLNVKSFLAGKRGVCPDCGVPVEIPMESDARALSSKKKSSKGGEDQEAKATAVLERPDSPELDISAPTPPEVPGGDDFSLPASLELPPKPISTPKRELEPAPAGAPPAAIPKGVPAAAAAPPPSPPSAADPIAEAPLAIWYVRPPAGGQYGPARGDVMRKWIGEGRVTSDSLVWREGWPDWRSALKTFPDMDGKSPAVGGIAPVVVETPRRPIRPARKASTAQGIGIVIILGLVCVGLFAALVYVLMNSGSVAPTP